MAVSHLLKSSYELIGCVYTAVRLTKDLDYASTTADYNEVVNWPYREKRVIPIALWRIGTPTGACHCSHVLDRERYTVRYGVLVPRQDNQPPHSLSCEVVGAVDIQ